MKRYLAFALSVVMSAVLLAGCGGGGGGSASVGSTLTNQTTTVVIRGRVNVPAAADPEAFSARLTDKPGPSQYQFIPLEGAAVTADGTTATTTTSEDGTFALSITYVNTAPNYPIKVSIQKGNILLAKYVSQSSAANPILVTPESLAVVLAYDKLTADGETGLDVDEMERKTYAWTCRSLGYLSSSISYFFTSGEIENLTTPLTQQNYIQSRVSALTDVDEPFLEEVDVSDSTVSPGDDFTVTVHVNEDTGMNSGTVALYHEDTSIDTGTLSTWSYDSTTQTRYSSVTLTIPDYSPSGTYYLSVSVTDSKDNSANYFSTQDEHHVPTSYGIFTLTSKLPAITVTATGQTDTTAPTILSFEVIDGDITDKDDTAVIRATVQETQSGMKDLRIGMNDDVKNISNSGSCETFSAATQTGQYTCDIEIPSWYAESTGTFHISYAYATDNLGNQEYYSENELPDQVEIDISYAAVTRTSTVTVSGVTFSPASASPGHEIEMTATVNAESAPNSITVYYAPAGEENCWSNNCISFSLTRDTAGDTGPWTYSDSTQVNPYLAAGTYEPLRGYIYFYEDGEYWDKTYDIDNPDDAVFLLSLPNLTVTNAWNADSDGPEFVSATLGASSFVRGSDFKATITVSDDTWPSYIRVQLRRNPYSFSEPNEIFYLTWYESFPSTTAGRWTYSVAEKLPENLAPGEWTLYSIIMYDLAGNDTNQTVSNVSFTLY